MNAVGMELNVVVGVVVASALQSIFGVGVLLFGTPILMLYGYGFSDILAKLLPISIGISLSQIIRDYRHIDIRFLGNVLVYSLPFIVLFLVIALKAGKDMGFLIAALLLLFALRNVFAPLNRSLEWLARFEKFWLIITGVVHGMTNLGGSLLTIIVQQKRYSKEVTRVSIASAYVTFAIFQLLTLLLTSEKVGTVLFGNVKYLLLGLFVYFMTNTLIYNRLNNQIYIKAFSAFLFCSGILLTIKSL